MILDPPARMLIEWQCTSLCYKAMFCIDTGDVDALLNLFTEDAELSSALGVFKGRDQIRSLFSSDRTGMTLRHVITNIHFQEVQADQADAVGYNTSYHAFDNDGKNPFETARLFELHDRYVRTEQGWLIKSRNSKIIFAPSDWIKESLDAISERGGGV